jgi:hypothetical protein
MNRFCEWLFGVSGPDLAGAEGWSLRPTGMPANASVLLGLLVVFGLLAWLVVHHYRREGAVPMRAKMWIASLRLAVLALVFLVLLQPALVARFTRAEAGAVVILLDDTLSMRWADRHPDPGHRAALAALLGVPEERLAGESRPSRAEAVRGVLARQGGVLSRLADRHPLALYRFGVTNSAASSYIEPLEEVAQAGGLEAAIERLNALQTDGRHTDVGRAVREALNRLENRRLAAVVVISDGRNTGLEKARLAGVAQLAAQRGVPLYAVAVGDPLPPANVAITQLLGPREARAGSKISFTALVAHRNLPLTTVSLQLWRSPSGKEDWEDTGERAELTVGGQTPAAAQDQAGALQEVTLTAKAPAVGSYAFKARLDPPREDSIAADNEASTLVRVTDQKMKVLLVSGGASWEFQFLRNFLLKSKDHYAVTVWQQNADPRFNQDASMGMKRTALPATRPELVEYDVVVLCDPRHVSGSLDERFIELLDEFVGKYQGGLCYLAGHKFAGRTLARRGALEGLGALLPVALAAEESAAARAADERQPYLLDLTTDGQTHPVLRLAGETAENVAQWRRLPAVYRCQRVTKLKPLASALAVCNDAGRAPQEQPEPFMASQYYGRGRVLFMGFDGTWRWRSLEDTALYERFWSNVMEFLGAGRLEKNRIVISTVGDKFDAGADIEVRVEAYNRDMNPLEAKALVVEMRPLEGGPGQRHTLRRERPGLYAGAIRAERLGAFELDAVSDEAGAADWSPQDVSTRRIEVRLPQAEFHRQEADYAALRELAGSDSRFLLLHEADTLAERIVPSRSETTSEVSHPIWSTKFTLLLFGVLLLTEWTLRKVYKMM